MRSLKRLLCFCLMIATAILISYPTATRAQTREVKPKATGSISGHVILNGKAAAGIPVAAYGGEMLARRIAAARTVTDSDGYYSLSQLAPAQYQVTTLALNLTSETGSGPSYGFVFFSSSKTIILAAGEMVSDVDIKLVRGGVLTGRIVDANDKPAVEERVALQLVDENGNPTRGGAPLPFNSQMYQTDDRGVYRIYGLPAGRYKVSVGSGSGGGIVSFSRRPYYPRTFYPDVSDQAKAAVIELTEGGEAANIDIKVGSPADAYSVFGRVIDSEGGLPVPGARISLILNTKDPERSGSFSNGATTNSRGEFRVEGLGPGRYGAYVSSENDGGTFYSDPAYFEVIDRDVSGVEIKAIRGLSLSGFVVTEGDAQKGALAQLANLRVSASIMQTSRTQLGGAGSSVVAADGSFQVDGLRPGRISVGVYTFGSSAIRPLIVRIEHGGIGLPQGFEIQQSVSGLRVVISYGTGTIRGTVRFEGGNLPADSRTYISCKREGANEGTGAQMDSRGRFVINNLAPGAYEVNLQVSVSRNSTYRPAQPQKQMVNVNNDAEAEVTFTVDLRPKEGGP
jgi:hypothetical protein